MKPAQFRMSIALVKFALAASLLIGLAGLAGEAEARPGGCVKGAIVGAVAGHLVGHGGIGAAAGCAYGMHERHQYDRQQMEQGRSSSTQGRAR